MRYYLSTRWATILLGMLMAIVAISVLYTNRIANKLSAEEHKKITLWAEATRQFILADENDDIDFLLQVMEGNTTIPVYMVDSHYELLLSRNVPEPKRNKAEYYAKRIAKLRASQEPIEVRISDDNIQYIYYEDSTLLKQLHYFPYIEFLLILAFVALAIVVMMIAQRSEQDSVWAGLSKETAHQLGTPISSLNAWNCLLKSRYPDDELLPEMDEDIARLQTIAERFSKVGSQPDLKCEKVQPVVMRAIEYMRVRSSNHVEYEQHYDGAEDAQAMICGPLFAWVVENIIKNAIDSMEGVGKITISVSCHNDTISIDITDTGKGIDRRKWKAIFEPGYTSKKRGWGLGLSLGKRIIEDYHGGKLFVKASQIGVGTTMCIQLKKAE